MKCPHTHLDGAYVLGALSPQERQEFEEHLATCDECSRAVRELAGLPGLLSRVDASVLEEPRDVPPVPETLLPALVGSVRRARRRRWVVSVGAAAAAVVAAVAIPLAVQAHDDPAPVAAGHVMTPIGGAPVRASLVMTQVAWGTKLDLTCTYDPTPEEYQLPHVALYVLVVTKKDGGTEQVGTWSAQEGRTMRLSAATAATRDDITSVQVRTESGRTVLELQPT